MLKILEEKPATAFWRSPTSCHYHFCTRYSPGVKMFVSYFMPLLKWGQICFGVFGNEKSKNQKQNSWIQTFSLKTHVFQRTITWKSISVVLCNRTHGELSLSVSGFSGRWCSSDFCLCDLSSWSILHYQISLAQILFANTTKEPALSWKKLKLFWNDTYQE